MRRNINVGLAATWLGLMILAGCGGAQPPIAAVPGTTLPVQTALPASAVVAFLEQKGYRVLSYEGTVETYQLTKAQLISYPYIIYWGLQTIDPAPYLGKQVQVEKYLVTNHPLDTWTSGSTTASPKGAGKTALFVFVVENQPIGGTSFPVTDEALAGGYWSLDGRTLEEVQQISDFQTWQAAWIKRFQE